MKTVKMFGLFILTYLMLIPLAVLLVFDRLIVSFWITKDMPGLYEIKEFQHEREDFVRRYGLYIAVFVVYLIVRIFI